VKQISEHKDEDSKELDNKIESDKNSNSDKSCDVNEASLSLLRGYWKLSAIAQFIKVFHPFLGIGELTPTELEQ
jgi:hypothetical protein